MSVYALRLQNAADTAARVRLGDLLGLGSSSALGARSGIRPGGTAADVAVVAGTMQVTVQPFLAWVDGSAGDTQGGYPFVCDAPVTLTLDDGHGTLSRTDVIAAVVRDDTYDGSGSVSATVEVIKGTPGAGVPAMPSNVSAVPIRNVTVPAGLSTGSGGLASGNLSTDRRPWLAALGAPIPVSSTAERDALPAIPGLQVYRRDADRLQYLQGSTWVTVDAGAEDQTTPAVDPNVTASGQGVAVVRRGRMATLAAEVTLGLSWPANDWAFLTIPPGYRPVRRIEATWCNVNGTAIPVMVNTNGTVVPRVTVPQYAIVAGHVTYPLA